jgi:hypothetical protein
VLVLTIHALIVIDQNTESCFVVTYVYYTVQFPETLKIKTICIYLLTLNLMFFSIQCKKIKENAVLHLKHFHC